MHVSSMLSVVLITEKAYPGLAKAYIALFQHIADHRALSIAEIFIPETLRNGEQASTFAGLQIASGGVQLRSQKLMRMSAHRKTGGSSMPPVVNLRQLLHAGWHPRCE